MDDDFEERYDPRRRTFELRRPIGATDVARRAVYLLCAVWLIVVPFIALLRAWTLFR